MRAVKTTFLISLELVLWLGLYIVVALITILISVKITFFLLGGRPTGGFGDMVTGIVAIYCGVPIGVVLAAPITYFVYIHSFGRLFEKLETKTNQK